MHSQQPCTPKLLQDRSMATAVNHLSLSPKMHLLALVLESNAIAIFRTNWQRLATIPVSTSDDDKITCLTWSPDGANILVATTAALSIYSVDRAASASTTRAKRATKEATEPIATMQFSPFPTALTWSPCFSQQAAARDRLTGLPQYPDRATMVTSNLPDDFGPSGLGLLLIGDSKGAVTIMTHNLQFKLAHVQIMPPGHYIERIHLTPALRHCLVVGCDSATHPYTVKKDVSDQGTCVFRAVDLETILEYWPEINRLGKDVMAFHHVSQKLDELQSCMRKNWTDGATDVLASSISKPLRKLIVDFAEESDFHGPWHALHDVFCGARMSGAMLQFLAAELSENGAKEALRAFRSYIDDVDAILMSILPSCENMVFRASEHRGLARLTSRFAAIGVDLKRAATLFDVAEKLCLQLGEFVCETEKKSGEGEAFLAWLVLAAARAGGEVVQGKGSNVGTNLEGRDALLVSQFFKTMTGNFSQEMGAEFQDVISQSFTQQIIPLIEEYRKVFDNLINHSCSAISSALVPTQGMSVPIRMSRTLLQQKCFIYDIVSKTVDDTVVLLCIVDANGHLVTIRHSFIRLEWGIKYHRLDGGNPVIHDAAVLGTSEVVVITSEADARDEKLDGVKTTLSLDVVHCDNDADSYSDMMLPTSEEVFAANMPDIRSLDGSNRRSITCGQMEKKVGVSLALNSNLELASVLLRPRRILVFDLVPKSKEYSTS